MGTWKLEVAKFALYVFAPVASFYYFHKVEYFEDKIAESYRKQYSVTSAEGEKQIRECQEKMREKREARFKEQLATLEERRPSETRKLKEQMANMSAMNKE